MTPEISLRAKGVKSSAIRDLLANARKPGMLSLAGGLPNPDTFPNDLLAAAAQRMLAGREDVLQYSATEGDQRLREHIARLESGRQGHAVDPASVLITTGSQQALTMTASVLLDAGDTIAVPHPCYLGALQTFGAASLRTHPVAIRNGRLDLDRFEAELRAGTVVRAMYVIANHGNPDGYRLDDTTNRRLAELADTWGFWLLEDDPYRELWFDTPPAAALGAHTANVLSLGSFSKTTAPGLRVGWVVATGDARAALIRTKQSADLHTSSLSQALIVSLMDTPGWFAEHTAMLRAMYAGRRDALCAALADTFGEGIEFDRPSGGMFAWARLQGVNTSDLLAVALEHGVCFVPGAEFASATADPLTEWIRLSFATLAPEQLHEAVARLAAAIAGANSSPVVACTD